MKLTRSQITRIVDEATTKEELRDSVVYIISGMKTGDEIMISRKSLKMEETSFLIFIDLEPMANWSHKCRYILVGVESNTMEIIDGHFPPDSEKLLLFNKPDAVEEWMVLTEKKFIGQSE